uniref:Venom protein n=1 Tax=Ampulex compressa TaxID=860918 RepID=A0A1W6EW97_AMPCP|nr:venom protein [Ampulex compressa]
MMQIISVNCDRPVLFGNDAKSCALVKCRLSGAEYSLRYCNNAISDCGKARQIRYHTGDKNAEYPNCCSYPICAY